MATPAIEPRAKAAAPKPRSSLRRMTEYTKTVEDPEFEDAEIVTSLLVTRSVEGVTFKTTRTQRGRTTEIPIQLNDDERRELVRLLS